MLIKNFFGLVEMTFGLVPVSYSLPEWKKTDFLCTLITYLIYFTLHNGFNCWMLGHLSYDSSISTTDNKNLKKTK